MTKVLFLVYQTQLDLALKAALRYSWVEELEVAFLRGIRDWLLRFNQQTEKAFSNETTGRIGGQRFILHILTCANTSLIVGVVD